MIRKHVPNNSSTASLRFPPVAAQLPKGGVAGSRPQRLVALGAPDHVIAAFEDVSRRIQDLARELNCLGHFDDEPDRPRAA